MLALLAARGPAPALLVARQQQRKRSPPAGGSALAKARQPLTIVAFRGEASTASGKTPYTGSRRRYGFYKCTCGRTWESAYSWGACAQECQRCGAKVYPWRQEPLIVMEGVSHIDRSKAHPVELCDKCRELGFPCWMLDDDETGVIVTSTITD